MKIHIWEIPAEVNVRHADRAKPKKHKNAIPQKFRERDGEGEELIEHTI